MKAVTLKPTLAWEIFNTDLLQIKMFGISIQSGQKILIHVSANYNNIDLQLFRKRNPSLDVPSLGRLLKGQVIGSIEVLESTWNKQEHCYIWKIANPIPIHRFFWKGSPNLFDIPDKYIDFDATKNPILEESGQKLSGTPPLGKWRVTVWRHPFEENRYSYYVSLAGGLMGGGIGELECYHGCFDSPEQALDAGINEGVYGRVTL